ncbi:hypothetical protein BpHYR1_001987, partial [Brachionus plicatilis]
METQERLIVHEQEGRRDAEARLRQAEDELNKAKDTIRQLEDTVKSLQEVGKRYNREPLDPNRSGKNFSSGFK